jgi:ABC-type uncharacterized transport system permease subunit
MLIAILWIVLFEIINKLIFNRALRKITVQGA